MGTLPRLGTWARSWFPFGGRGCARLSAMAPKRQKRSESPPGRASSIAGLETSSLVVIRQEGETGAIGGEGDGAAADENVQDGDGRISVLKLVEL